MRYIIDRFEGKYAVVELEDGSMENVPRNALPEDAREGDIVTLGVDAEGTARKKEEIKGRLNRLFKK